MIGLDRIVSLPSADLKAVLFYVLFLREAVRPTVLFFVSFLIRNIKSCATGLFLVLFRQSALEAVALFRFGSGPSRSQPLFFVFGRAVKHRAETGLRSDSGYRTNGAT